MRRKNPLKTSLLLCLTLCCSLLLPASLYGKEVVLPLTLDYDLLTNLIRQGSFIKNNSVSIVGKDGDCTQVKVSDPVYSASGKLLQLEMGLYVQLGKELSGNCLFPVAWQGYITLLQQPVFDGQRFSLSFKTIDSKLYTLQRKPARVAGVIWEFVKSSVYPHLDQVRIDLAPPVTNLKNFLMALFPKQTTAVTRNMLNSLHGGQVFVREDAVLVQLIADVETVYEPTVIADHSLVAAELQSIVALWETWDVFLVQLITSMAGQFLDDVDRQVLVDVLFSARYAFAKALEERTVAKDFVRIQFVSGWRQLAPVFRKQLHQSSGDNTLGYLAFFTAADALTVFDRMGPTIGIEISQQGLLRLARMLDNNVEALRYVPEVDDRLREFLQLPPQEEKSSPFIDLKEIDLEQQGEQDKPVSLFLNFFAKPLYAASMPTFKDIIKWKVPRGDVDDYSLKVRKVLDEAVETVLVRDKIPASLHPMFKVMIPAMAWQESCLRQFVVKKRKLTYLLSYNNSSVGLMQVNERIWRGIYDRGRLRWDINYNALAGSEIAGLYLRKYALRNRSVAAGSVDSNTLAKAVYAMYNGGPGQYKKYFARNKTKKLYKSDLLFAEKLEWVLGDNWQKLSICLIGG